MYVKAFDDGTIPDTETLLLTHLSNRVCWPTVTANPAKPNQLPTASDATKLNELECAHFGSSISAWSYPD